MKLCTAIRVLALSEDGQTITEAEPLECSLVEDDHSHEPLGRPLQVGDTVYMSSSVEVVEGDRSHYLTNRPGIDR